MANQNKICTHCNGNGYIKVGDVYTDCLDCDNQGEINEDEVRILLNNTIWRQQ